MNPQVDVAELLRYLTGESPEDEVRRVQAWCRLHTANAALLEALRYSGDKDVAQLEVDVARGMERLQNRLDGMLVPRTSAHDRALEPEEVVGLRTRQERAFKDHAPRWGVFKAQPLPRGVFKGQSLRQEIFQPVWRWTQYGVAALVIGMLGVVVGRHSQTDATDGQILGVGSTYTTANGERANITLPDGSTAALNVASRLTVPADYATGNHTVRLDGEALFTVSHHNEMPFVVLTRTTTTRVLGTKFLVRQFSTDTAATVAVAEGRVAVGKTVIVASQAISVGRTGVAHVGVADPSQFGFANGILALDGVPLSVAMHDLDRWYNVKLQLGDPRLATLPIIGEFTAGTMADLVDVLEGTFGLRIVRDGRVLALYPRFR